MNEWADGDVSLTHDVYDLAALGYAARDYRAHLTVMMVHRNAEETVVRFSRVDKPGAPAERVVREFLNYLLDLSVRARLSPNA